MSLKCSRIALSFSVNRAGNGGKLSKSISTGIQLLLSWAAARKERQGDPLFYCAGITQLHKVEFEPAQRGPVESTAGKPRQVNCLNEK